MGVAILSGVLASLDAKSALVLPQPKWESHTPGTVTPQTLEDETLPSRYLACVGREETAQKLRAAFIAGRSVEILCARNVEAVNESHVVLLW